MPTVKGRGVTVKVDGRLVELKYGDEIPESLPKSVRDEIAEAEARNGHDVEFEDGGPAIAPEPDPDPPAVTVGGIEAYDDQNAGVIVPLITAENAAEVKAHEEQGKSRAGVLAACDKALTPA